MVIGGKDPIVVAILVLVDYPFGVCARRSGKTLEFKQVAILVLVDYPFGVKKYEKQEYNDGR